MPSLVMNENKLVIAALLIPFSIAGTLIRIGVTRLQDYEGAPVFSLVYAQWIGCLVMGIALSNKSYLFQRLKYPAIYTAITTGLCGSITTFSSWQLDIFKAFVNYNHLPHSRGKNVLAGLSQLLVTLAMSFQGFRWGQHTATESSVDVQVVPRGFSIQHLQWPDYGVVCISLSCWLGVILAAVWTHDTNKLVLACVFAPLGALTRWSLSSLFNTPHLPKGTLIANLVATVILAVLSLVRSRPINGMSCLFTQALADGYCGCLSTISTWITELDSLPRKSSYVYGTISVVIAQCILFIVLGSSIWTLGIDSTC
ncbi:CrcB-like protein-domain-containing protein [Choanephora cucurbitarum]|nr:CrcB-like protein-domain-containing protein [Choanephora cucurbitarum]